MPAPTSDPMPRRFRAPSAALAVARLAVLACLALAAPAQAEKADRDKPLNIEADRMQYDDLKQVSTFTGRVVLTKGTIEIRADRLTVRQDAEGWQYGTAWGELATFRQKRDAVDEWIEGRAKRLDYDGRLETVRLQQQATMQRTDGSRVLEEIHGSDILYESRTEFFTVEGGAGTTGTGATAANPSGRVRMVIQPRTSAGGQAPAAPTAPAAPPASLKPAERLAPGAR